MEWLECARSVFDSEITAAVETKNCLDDSFCVVCEAIDNCKGRVIVTGMGKSGHVCRKIAATMQSLGIKAFFLHPAEALHGDLGMLTQDDILIAASKSGESAEILALLPAIRMIGLPVYSIVGRKGSTLERYSQAVIQIADCKEAFLDTIVPTSSSTATLIVGDALAVAVAEKRGFKKHDFGLLHPNGLLGKRLTMQVQDLMLVGSENAVISEDATVGDAVFEMCRKPIGGVNLVDADGTLVGVFTDGDMRRLYQKTKGNMDAIPIKEVMTKNPIVIQKTQLVANVVEDMKRDNRMVSFYPVVEDMKVVGSLRLLDISKSGLL